ncbi:MAG: pentapeptide repeat-containing protein [Leptolyngbya sp. SIO4C5]|nr:pentapeptide repeat-containing protein [Leptolyngbya sp. SIO4C5]
MMQHFRVGLRQLARVGLVACLVGLTLCLSSFPAWAQDNMVDYTLTDLSYRDFSSKNLEGTSFAGAEVRRADFKGANLKGTILTKASFLETDLSGANLSGAFADRVVFDGANFTNALFTDAIATSSTFTDAVIQGADFSNTILDRYQIAQMCDYADGINSVTGIATRDSLGCR